MKKSNLKAISFFLMIAMMVSLFNVNVFAEPVVYDISANGDNSLTATYDSTTYTLTISGSGAMMDYASYSSVPYTSVRKAIQTVIFDEGCTISNIGSYAFYEATSLTNIDIPSTVTTIGKEAFYDTRKLTSAILPEGVTTIGESAFYKSYVKKIEIPSTVISIGKNAFTLAKYVDDITIEANLVDGEIKEISAGEINLCI